MDTIEGISGQEQSREDPDETMRMHMLILTFAIRMQYEFIITRVQHRYHHENMPI